MPTPLATFFNVDELAFDFVVAMFAFFAGRFIAPSKLLAPGTRLFLIVASAPVFVFLPHYLVYSLFETDFQDFISRGTAPDTVPDAASRIMGIILLLSFLTAILLPFWIAFYFARLGVVPDEAQGVFFLTALFVSLISMVVKFSFYAAAILGVVLLFEVTLALVVVEAWLAALVTFLLLVFCVWMLRDEHNFLRRRLQKELRGKHLPPKVQRLLIQARRILLPLLFAFSFVLWQQIQVAASVVYSHKFPDDVSVMASLILSGLIPIRLVLAFKPPFKPASLAVGVLVFALYIKSLVPMIG